MINETIVFGVWPELGAYNASLRLAKEIAKHGFKVVYVGPAHFQKYVEGQGLSYAVIPERIPPKEAAGGRVSWFAMVRDEMREYGAAMEWLENWIDSHKPALLLLDQCAWFFSPPFLKHHVPILALGLNYSSNPSPSYPPVFCGVVPVAERPYFSLVRNVLAWAACFGVFWLRQFRFYVMTKLVSWLTRDPHLYGKSLVEKYGGRVRHSEYGYQLALPEMVLVPRELDFARGNEWHRDHFYGGMGVDPDRMDTAGDPEENEFPWERLDGQRKLIFCSLGTFSARYPEAGRFYRVVLEAFRQRPDLQLVLAVGKSAPEDVLRHVPENVILKERVPFIEVLKRASVLITHGGCTSVREALLFGVPMIVFPCWCDQPGNGARVAYHGIGRVGDIRKIEPEGLGSLLQEVLNNPAFAQQAKRLSDLCQQRVHCETGVELILKYLNPRGAKPAHNSSPIKATAAAG